MSNPPYLDTDQMREVDRAMIEEYHIKLIQMMENAGRNLAHLARTRFLGGNPRGKQVVVLAGRGGNGGGGLVCARRLHNWGAQVTVATTHEAAQFSGVPGHQMDVAQRMGVEVHEGTAVPPTLSSPHLIIDALIGYSLSGAPRGTARQLIEWANAQNAPILSLDAPSGLDTTTGTVYDPAMKATATMTLALPKIGLKAGLAAGVVGELYLADISVPPGLYVGLGLDVGPIFAKEEIVRVTG